MRSNKSKNIQNNCRDHLSGNCLIAYLRGFIRANISVCRSRFNCEFLEKMNLAGIFLIIISCSRLSSQVLKIVVFEDDFEGDEIDERNWKFAQTLSGGGDWQFQWFVKDRENAFLRDGALHIKPTLTADKIGEEMLWQQLVKIDTSECTSWMNYGCERQGTPEHLLNPIRSASISTKESFAFGVVEIRAKVPAGDWLRPTIKLSPRVERFGPWPASGEIVMLESRGNRQLFNYFNQSVGVDQITSTLHFGPSYDANGWNSAQFKKTASKGLNEDFHVYKMEWREDGFRFLVDDEEYGNVTIDANSTFWELGKFEQKYPEKSNPWAQHATPMSPFDQEFYLTIELAVGGVSDFFSDAFENREYEKPWVNLSTQALLKFWQKKHKWHPTWTQSHDSVDFVIDYVKVYRNE